MRHAWPKLKFVGCFSANLQMQANQLQILDNKCYEYPKMLHTIFYYIYEGMKNYPISVHIHQMLVKNCFVTFCNTLAFGWEQKISR